MTDDTETFHEYRTEEAAVVADVTLVGTKPVELDPAEIYSIIVPAGAEQRTLDLSEYLAAPRRVKGVYEVHDFQSFVDYVEQYRDPEHTTLWVDPKTHKVVAVLNDNASHGTAGVAKHPRVGRPCRRSSTEAHQRLDALGVPRQQARSPGGVRGAHRGRPLRDRLSRRRGPIGDRADDQGRHERDVELREAPRERAGAVRVCRGDDSEGRRLRAVRDPRDVRARHRAVRRRRPPGVACASAVSRAARREVADRLQARPSGGAARPLDDRDHRAAEDRAAVAGVHRSASLLEQGLRDAMSHHMKITDGRVPDARAPASRRPARSTTPSRSLSARDIAAACGFELLPWQLGTLHRLGVFS